MGEGREESLYRANRQCVLFRAIGVVANREESLHEWTKTVRYIIEYISNSVSPFRREMILDHFTDSAVPLPTPHVRPELA